MTEPRARGSILLVNQTFSPDTVASTLAVYFSCFII